MKRKREDLEDQELEGSSSKKLRIDENESANDVLTLSMLPNELLMNIAKYLSIKSLFALMRTSSMFYSFSTDNYVWRMISHRLGIQPGWHSELDDDQKLRTHSFLTIRSEVARIFPTALIQAFGLSTLAQCPTLDLGDDTGSTGYLDFVSADNMGDYAIAWGTDAISRPFISIKYNVTTPERSNSPQQTTVNVETIFKRFNNVNDSSWAVGSHHSYYNCLDRAQQQESSLHPAFLNYIARLNKQKNCGIKEYDFEQRTYIENMDFSVTLYKKPD